MAAVEGRKTKDEVLAIAGELVRAVGAAFYQDPVQIVLDMLLRFDYLRGDQVNRQLGITGSKVQEAIEELVADGLLKREEFNVDERGHSKTFYYINFRHFLDVVAFRVYMMQQVLKQRHRNIRHEQKWQCANCKTIYDALDVLQYHHESGKFYCPRCSLVAGRLATPFFLEQTHTNQEEEEVLDLQRKIGEQLNGEDGLRPSLYDLIGRARAVEDQLPYNHPYETSRYREEFKINSRRSPNPDQQLAFARAGLGYGGGATGNGGANGGPANGGGELRSTSPMPGGSLFENSAIFAHVDVPQGPPPEMMRADYAVEVTLDSTGNAVESKLTEVETVHEQREHALPGFLKDARATMMQATSLARENEAKPEAAAAPAPPAPAAAAPAAAAAASATPAAVDDDDDDSDVEWED